MKSGGYKVIDLKNIPLSNFAVNIPGIYEQIEASNKLCVVSGLYAGGIEYDDTAVLFTGGSTFVAKITDTLTLSIRDNDNVTVIVTTPVEEMAYIDGKSITIPANGIITDINTVVAFVNLCKKNKPFYLKDFDFSTLGNVDGDRNAAHLTVIPYVSNVESNITGGFSYPSSEFSYIRFTVNEVLLRVRFTKIV